MRAVRQEDHCLGKQQISARGFAWLVAKEGEVSSVYRQLSLFPDGELVLLDLDFITKKASAE